MYLIHFVCSSSTCELGKWNCTTKECKVLIECPNNQEYRDDLTSCGLFCATHLQPEDCTFNSPAFEGCGCPPDRKLNNEARNNYLYFLPYVFFSMGRFKSAIVVDIYFLLYILPNYFGEIYNEGV